MMSQRAHEALILATLAAVILLLVFAALFGARPARYAPAKGRGDDYDRFMHACVAERADITGHMATCNRAATELGLAVVVE